VSGGIWSGAAGVVPAWLIPALTSGTVATAPAAANPPHLTSRRRPIPRTESESMLTVLSQSKIWR
jgi:hypothetical protein